LSADGDGVVVVVVVVVDDIDVGSGWNRKCGSMIDSGSFDDWLLS